VAGDRDWLGDWRPLLDEPDRVQAEVGVGARLDQPCRFFHSLGEADVLHGNSQQFAAHLVIFHDAKAQVHRVERAGSDGFIAERLHVGKWKWLFHLPIWCTPPAKRCTKLFYRSNQVLFDDPGSFDVIEVWKRFFQISVSLLLNARLIGVFTVAGVDLVHIFHPADHLADGRES
jgi:hypothetical protein